MSGKKARKFYWDACIFLAWIKQETGWPDDVTKAIQQMIDWAKAKQIVIVTSALTKIEVLAAKLTVEQKARFRSIFAAPYFQLVDLDRRVSDKASVIREHYDSREVDKDGNVIAGSIMAMGDSIHLATAIHFNIDEFITLDGAGKRQRRLDILSLDGDVAGARLSIHIPKYVPPVEPLQGDQHPVSGNQPSLFDTPPEEVRNETAAPITPPTEPISAELRGDSNGHPPNQTGTGPKQTAEAETVQENPITAPPKVVLNQAGGELPKTEAQAQLADSPEEIENLDLSKELENETPASMKPTGDAKSGH